MTSPDNDTTNNSSFFLGPSTAKKYFWTNKDGQNILIREWLLPQPDSGWDRKPIGNVFIIHGLHEHSGYYEELALQFHEAECNVIAFDMIGHGESDGERFMIYDFEPIVRDIVELMLLYRTKCKVPAYFFGTGVGATLALIASTQNLRRIRGLMLQGIFLNIMHPKHPDRFIREFARMCKTICPTFPVIHFPIQDLTQNIQMVCDIFTDPLYYTDKAKATTIVAFIKLIDNLPQLISKELRKIPLFIIHGEEDKISPVKNSENLKVMAHACGDKILHIAPGCYHHVHTDPSEKEALFKKLIKWLRTRKNKVYDDSDSE